MSKSARVKPTVYSLVNVIVFDLLHRPQDDVVKQKQTRR